jgi:hypothetical protein
MGPGKTYPSTSDLSFFCHDGVSQLGLGFHVLHLPDLKKTESVFVLFFVSFTHSPYRVSVPVIVLCRSEIGSPRSRFLLSKPWL